MASRMDRVWLGFGYNFLIYSNDVTSVKRLHLSHQAKFGTLYLMTSCSHNIEDHRSQNGDPPGRR